MKKFFKTKGLWKLGLVVVVGAVAAYTIAWQSGLIAEQSNVEGVSTGNGFDQFGYNNQARLFNGILQQWCAKKGISDPTTCGSYGFGSVNDKLVMKWNAEWDRGNAESWGKPPYNAWTDNEWNGRVAGGSGVVWHYKIVWIGPCGADGTSLSSGGYCIWGQFAVVMDQGSDKSGSSASCLNKTLALNNGGHGFCALGSPAGYGAYFSH